MFLYNAQVTASKTFKNDSPFLLITKESVLEFADFIDQHDVSKSRASDIGQVTRSEADISRLESLWLRFRPNIVVEAIKIENSDSATNMTCIDMKDLFGSDSINSNLKISFPMENVTNENSSTEQRENSMKGSFSYCGPCERCTMINIDPSTGIKDDGACVTTYKYLSTVSRQYLNKSDKLTNKVTFGVYLDFDKATKQCLNHAHQQFKSLDIRHNQLLVGTSLTFIL